MRSSAKFGCYQFPQQFMRSSQFKAYKPEQTANRHQYTYEIKFCDLSFFLLSETVLHLACLSTCCKATIPWKDAAPVPVCWSSYSSSSKKDFSTLQSMATHASRECHSSRLTEARQADLRTTGSGLLDLT